MNADAPAPRYATLRDYLAVLRQRRVLIISFTVGFALAGYLLGLSQHDRFRSTAAIRFTDPAAVFSDVSTSPVPRQDAGTIAVQRSIDAVSDPVKAAVEKRLGSSKGIGVTAFDEARTELVDIEITANNGDTAAKWANAWADAAVKFATVQARTEFRRSAAALRSQTAQLGNSQSDIVTRAALNQRAATLESAAAVVHPGQVVRPATAAAKPYTPDRLRDAIVGGLLGLTIGLVIAFVRDALDRRVRRVPEIEADLQAPVLGHVYSAAMREPPFIANGNKRNRFMLPNTRRRLAESTLEGFQILRTNLEALNRGDVQTVMVTSALPGEGKSTVAVGLAGAAVQTGRVTLLVECDLRRPSLAKRLGIESHPGLGDYLSGDVGPNDVLRVVQLDESGGGGELVVIPAGTPREESAKLFSSERFSQFLDQVRESYEVVVLDTGPVLSLADPRDIARHVDAVLLCVRASRTTREQARAAKGAIDQVSEHPAGIVVTDLQPGQDETLGYYQYRYST
jgi:capsular exopolysaccharide synthesis family protein